MHGRLFLIVAFAALVCPPFLYAQSTQPEAEIAAPAHVSRVEGTASLEREGRSEGSLLNMPLLSGDRLRTTDGRVEVLFGDGSTLHLDTGSTIDVQSDELVRLTEGRLRLNILGPQRTVTYRIDSPAGSARITQPGEYRVAFLRAGTEPQLELAVVRGAAEVFTDLGATPVRAGERAYASAGLMPSYAYAYNSANQDAFDRWSESRRDVRLGVSSQHLPAEIQAYAPVLDESGEWRATESYGYAWYPRVAPDWRPYYYGRWDSYPRYGWTWIGADRFAWPTHHYGRWGFSAGAWFWIPSRRWAPAYVSWAYAPGYVSWCPLGFDNRPIFSINVFRTGYSPWRGWTAVSYSHFGSRGYSVHSRAVNWNRYGGQHPRFQQRPSAPGLRRDIAVPRNSAPIRWAGSRDLQPDRLRQGSGAPEGRSQAAGTRRPESLPPSGGRSAAVDRQNGNPPPRYINRGDEIVRSQTGRPVPRDTSGVTRPAPEGYAIPRPSAPSAGAAPFGAESRRGTTEARPFGRSDAAPRTTPDASTGSAPPRAESRGDGSARPSRSESTPFEPSRPAASPRVDPRGGAGDPRPRASGGVPAYQPYEPARRAEPRSGIAQTVPTDVTQPRTRASGGNPSYDSFSPPAAPASPRAEPRGDGAQRAPYQTRTFEPRPAEPRDGGARGRPAPDTPRAAPVERAPNRGEGRQPSSERASAPASRPAPSGGSGAVPRRGRGGA